MIFEPSGKFTKIQVSLSRIEITSISIASLKNSASFEFIISLKEVQSFSIKTDVSKSRTKLDSILVLYFYEVSVLIKLIASFTGRTYFILNIPFNFILHRKTFQKIMRSYFLKQSYILYEKSMCSIIRITNKNTIGTSERILLFFDFGNGTLARHPHNLK